MRVESFGSDPAEGDDKHVEVAYSYGNQTQHTVSRPEYSRFVIPEDTWLVEELRKAQQPHPPNPILFADAIQRINGTEDSDLSWWHVPISVTQELRFCIVELQINSRRFEMLWSVGHGDKPQRRVDLAKNDIVNVPIAARAETENRALSAHPRILPTFPLERGIALLTDDQVISHGAIQRFHSIAVGENMLQITVVSGDRRFTAWYMLYVPDKHVGNGHFYMRRRD
jgi:hypothetical protein